MPSIRPIPPRRSSILRAALAGALALVGANVVDARTYTTKDGYATAAFWIQDAEGSPYEADRLPRLIQTRLIQSLENSGRLKSVSRPGDKIVSDYQLISEIRAFDIAAGSGEAVVDISAKIIAEGTGKVIAARIFTARVPVQKVDAGTAAVGLDAALARVLGEMVAWVNSGR